MKVLFTAACLALSLFAAASLTLPMAGLGVALAADAPAGGAAPQGGDRFTGMDVDSNGAVTWEEFSVAMPKMKRGAFDAIDKDKNGGISREEWETFRAGHGSGGSMGGQMGSQTGSQAGSPMGGMPPAGSAPAADASPTPGPEKPSILPPSKK